MGWLHVWVVITRQRLDAFQSSSLDVKETVFTLAGILMEEYIKRPKGKAICNKTEMQSPCSLLLGSMYMLNCKINGTVHIFFLKSHISAPGAQNSPILFS